MAIPVVLFFFLAISTIFTPPCTADGVLYPGDRLSEGESITTDNYVLTMENDCNLVLFDNLTQIWHSDTRGKGSGCYATLLDGEFVIKDNTGKTVWTRPTKPEKLKNCVIILQRDRNLVLYCGAVWSTNTYIPPVPKALGRKMGIGNGGDDFHRAFVLVINSEEESELGSMITQVVNE